MATLTWAALILAAACQDEPTPGQFTVTNAGREQVFNNVVYHCTDDSLIIGSDTSPGPQFHLARKGDRWVPTARSGQRLIYGDGTGGTIEKLDVDITDDDGRLVGTWSGTLVGWNRRTTRVSGRFNLAPPPADSKPSVFIGGVGCVVLCVLVFINAGVNLWFISTAFQESALWGLAVLFVPFAPIAFVAMHWDAAKRPFLWSMGTGVVSLGVLMLFGAMLG